MKRPTFEVRTTPRFDRRAARLNRRHPGEFTEQLARALEILTTDPYNASRQHPIRKLVAVKEGRFRLRLRRFRFRYDVEGKTVFLKRCSLRNESTYRR